MRPRLILRRHARPEHPRSACASGRGAPREMIMCRRLFAIGSFPFSCETAARKRDHLWDTCWSRARKVSAAENGSSLVELALLTPLLLLLFAGSVDLGQACFVAIEVSAAASAGTAYGVQNPTDTSGMQKAAVLDAPNLSGLSAVASWGCECSDGTSPSASCGTNPTCGTTRVKYVAVSTALHYVPVFGLPGLPSNLLLMSTSRLRAAY